MRYLLPKLLALSAATVVLTGGLALAQSTPGSAGKSGETAAKAIDVKPTLPASIQGVATTRDIATDAPADVSAYATVRRASDGTVSIKAPSAELAAALGKETVANASGAGAAALQPPPTKLTPVKSTTAYPYRTVGELDVSYGDHTYACTGTLIGPSTVITAAACLWGFDGGNPVFTDKVVFYPGATDGQAPNGQYDWDGNAAIMQGFITGMTTATSAGALGGLPFGIGIVTLAQPAGNTLGWMGFQTDLNKSYQPKVITYNPQDFKQLSTTSCNVDVASMYRSYAFPAPCLAAPWGSPLYVENGKQQYITGLNIYIPSDNSPYGFEARISAITYQWITEFRK